MSRVNTATFVITNILMYILTHISPVQSATCGGKGSQDLDFRLTAQDTKPPI